MALSSKRAVLLTPGKPLQIWDEIVPEPGLGEVLIRTELSGVCGTDVHLAKGEVDLPGPIVLGHEGVGRIEILGKGLRTDYAGTPISPGDRVYWVPLHPCGHCYGCTVEEEPTHCGEILGQLFQDASKPPVCTYSELALLPQGMAFYRIPEDTPSDAVIAFGCAMPTMLKGVERLGGITVNDTVVIQGAGPVGLAATLLAHASGARKIIAIGGPAHRLAMATKMGATATVSIEDMEDAEERRRLVLDLTDGRGADIVIEGAGYVPAFEEGIRLAARGGRYLVAGLWSAPGTVAIEPRYINNMNLRIIGTALYEGRHIHGAIRVAQAFHRELPMVEAITHRFLLDEAQLALGAVARQDAIKALIVPGGI